MRRATGVSALALLVLPGFLAAQPPGLPFAAWTELGQAQRAEGPALVRVPVAALILSGQTGGAVRTALLATPAPATAGAAPVSVLVEAELAGLAAADEGTHLEVETFVYALDDGGAVAALASQSTRLERGLVAGLDGGGLKVVTALDLVPGEYSLRALVRNRATGAFGLARSPLRVPNGAAESEALLAPWLPEPLDRWLVSLPAAGAREDAVLRPLLAAGGVRLPAARPVLVAGEAAEGYALLVAGRPGPWRLVARMARADGLQVAEVPAVLGVRLATGWPGLEAVEVSLPTPDLPEGRYWLLLTLLRDGAEPVDSPPLTVVVAPRRGGDRIAWTGLLAAPDEGGESGPGEAEPAARRAGLGVPAEEVAARYRDALERLSRGDAGGARRALVELEQLAARAVTGPVLRRLGEIEWAVLAELAADAWPPLTPAIALHGDVVSRHREADLAPLAEHALRMATRLGKAIAQQVATSEEAATLSAALTRLGTILQRSSRLGESDLLFEEALRLDRENLAATLALARNHEHLGRYDEAARRLRRVLALDAAHAEGRLRLAVNLDRLGRPRRARELLEPLVGGAAEEWIAILAVQEAARLALAEGEAARAARLLESAVARWPEEPALRLQLAFVLDRQARPDAVRRLVRGLLAGGDAGTGSARYRYNRWPEPPPLKELPALAAAPSAGPGAAGSSPASATPRGPR